MPSLMGKYYQKLKRRDARISGFLKKFLLHRLVKSLISIPSALLLIFVIFLKKKNTVLYRPNPRNLHQLENLNKDTLVIGTKKDNHWATKAGFSYFPFYPIYSLSNFGLMWPWLSLLGIVRPKRIFIWTDFGLDQFLAIETARRVGIKVWCIQHGLFPVENNCDLDGLDSNVNIVSSESQKRILIASGYKGKVVVFKHLFGEAILPSFVDLERTLPGGMRTLVFVGAGYTHKPELEDKIVELLRTLASLLRSNYKIIYRPHPRDSNIKLKIKQLGVECVSGAASSYENSQNMIFLGIKSTFLIEAQNSGKLVFLITGNWIPKYFEAGEIHNELPIEMLGDIKDYIEAKVTDLLGNS